MAEVIQINGLSANEVYETIRDRGVPDVDAKLLVSNWIYQNYLVLHRTFSYVTEFPASVPACVPEPFARTFVHRDWVDGEDLVQAAGSANDDGFNGRFHRIETDLDALGAKVATLTQCMAAMRESLRNLLDEISAELNRVNSDLGSVKRPPVWRPPVFAGVSAGTAAQIPNLQFQTQAFAAQLPPGTLGDPMLSYLGSTVYQDKAVSMFNTSQGIMIMPAVDVSTPAMLDTRVGTAGAVSRATVENDDLNRATSQPFSKTDLVSRFGGLNLSNGQTLQQALAVLPADARYENLQLMIADLSTRTAGALQSTTGLAKQLAATMNAPAGATGFDTVDISGLKELPPTATSALRRAGIGTVGQLASAPAALLKRTLDAAGADLSSGEIMAIHGTAQTLSRMSIE
jgi:hypothetical protein